MMMNRPAFLLQLLSLLAFSASSPAEEVVASLMKVESARMEILEEAGDRWLILRAVLKNVSDKPLVIELSGKTPAPIEGQPVHRLHHHAFTYYDKFISKFAGTDEWLPNKLVGTYPQGPYLTVDAGTRITIEEKLMTAESVNELRRESYKDVGIRFLIRGSEAGEGTQKTLSEGFCKWRAGD